LNEFEYQSFPRSEMVFIMTIRWLENFRQKLGIKFRYIMKNMQKKMN